MRRLRWLLAIMLIVVIAFANSYPKTAITKWIIQTVYSTQDFAPIRQLIKRSEPIPIFVFDHGEKTLKNFEEITASEDGFILTYREAIRLYAYSNGVVIYSAHTATSGRAMIIAFDNGITAHFQQLTTIHKLPYTAVTSGEHLATVEGGQLFIALFKAGQPLTEKAVIRWIRNGQ